MRSLGDLLNKIDFDKWDKTQTEKEHFCKLFSEVNKRTSNHAVRAEVERFPLLLLITKRVLKYNMYLRSKDNNSIVKQLCKLYQYLTRLAQN